MPIFSDKRAGWLFLVAASVAVVAFSAALILLALLLHPTPPRSVTMATDPEGSFNADLAKRYREYFAQNGIDLKLVPFAGAVESVARLQDPKSGVSIAIIPGGITTQRDSPNLVSLGTLFYEPLWLFISRSDLARREQLRLSIGPEGSASHAFFVEFFDRVGIIDKKSLTLLSLTPAETIQGIHRGEVDGAVLLDAWESPVVHQLLAAENVSLESVPRADTFVALYPYLNKLVLPAGVADLARNRPPADVLLLAPKANLVVRSDVHPAIQYLLLEAAEQIQSPPGLFHKAAEFPAPESIELPLGVYARDFYKTGSPFLQRHLPFWLAVLVSQALVLAIPLIGVLFPLLRFAPEIYKWAGRRRVYGLYSELKRLEDQLAEVSHPGTAKDFIQRLDQMEDRISRQFAPASIRPLLYGLRSHIALVREAVVRKAGTP
jgi:TRAP-type uncharacterized transport system substrate-binding protein